MANMFDYITWRGDLTFAQDPPNEVDALIFSTLSYIHFGGPVQDRPMYPILLRDAAAYFFTMDDRRSRVRVENDMHLLELAANAPRFQQTKLVMYRDTLIPEEDTQFAAMTFLLDDGTAFLAFRGTDLTLVGWKEDFNMSFQDTVPSQLLAQQYVHDFCVQYDMPMRICGHSKGGNLAVFAAARSSPQVQKRIIQVYNNDGPGFNHYLMGDPGYLAMVPKITTLVPQSSIIGMLLEHEEPYTVLKSRSVSVWQHDPYTWEVLGRRFVPMEGTTENSRFLDATIKQWLASMTNQERSQLVDVLFSLLGSGGVETTPDMFHPKNTLNYLKTLSGDDNMRKVLSQEFMGLLSAARKVKNQMDADHAALEEAKQ